MKVAEIISLFGAVAPVLYQESYDNSGLQVGNVHDEVNGVLLSLDITEGVVEEAISKGCNLIIAHHPVIFSGIKKLTGSTYTQRIVRSAIKNDINLFAVHTNLDNMRKGINERIAGKLGLVNTRVLAPSSGTLLKLCTYVPELQSGVVLEALFNAGAGSSGNYSDCSFSVSGKGSFRGNEQAQPFIGVPGGAREWVTEQKIEVLVPVHLKGAVQEALIAAHPYEEVAYEWIELQNSNREIGAGLLGQLTLPMSEMEFLKMLKMNMKSSVVRHTDLLGKQISTVAVCGGSGSFLLDHALAAQADVFVSADFKYHQFFDAEGRILIADIGHYETEQFTVEIFHDILKKKNVTFAVLFSTLDTNPIKYF